MQFKSVLSTVDVHVCYRPSCLQYAHTAQAHTAQLQMSYVIIDRIDICFSVTHFALEPR